MVDTTIILIFIVYHTRTIIHLTPRRRRVDVSDRDDVLANAARVKAEVGDVTILVNNAGILPCKPMKDHPPELIEKVFRVNVFAHFWVR